MDAQLLNLPTGLFELIHIDTDAHATTVHLRSCSRTSSCPECGAESSKVHSHYVRCARDAPCAGRPCSWRLTVRRFFCVHEGCHRAIFCERLPRVLEPHAQSTQRARDQLVTLCASTSANQAHRLARSLGVRASASTCLRALHRAGAPEFDFGAVEAIGLDDFSWKRGQSWGTLVVDLETSRPLVLLQGRRREDVEPWLREHLPHVRIVSRDRAGAYSSAVSAACPRARQVADRWHLLKNVVDALVDAVRSARTSLRASR